MPQALWTRLPFLSSDPRHSKSAKGYPLDYLWEPAYGCPPYRSGRTPSRLTRLRNPHGTIRAVPNQILVWLGLGSRTATAHCGRLFPAILDTGFSHTLHISGWHLQHWLSPSANPPLTYDPFASKIDNFIQPNTAQANAGGGRITIPPALMPFLGGPLRDWHNDPSPSSWVAVVEADLWFFPNEPGERDELAGPTGGHRLRVDEIVYRKGDAPRLPLLGFRALRDARLVVAGGTCKLESLEIDLANACVNLSHGDPTP